MQEYFTPNASQPKGYPNGFNPPMRWICALHEDESGNVWLMKFRADIGEWEKERTATQADQDFFSFRKIVRCWHKSYQSGCSRCLAEVNADLARGREFQEAATARRAPAGSEEEAR